MDSTPFELTEADFDSVYGSKFVSAGDIVARGGKHRSKIAKVETADLRQDSGNTTRRRFVLYFDGLDKGMVLNQTNAGILKDALGKSPTKWVGADVGLYVEQVPFGNKRVPGLRLRVLGKPAAPAPATPPPAPAALVAAPVKPAPAEVDPKLNDDPGPWTPNEDWVRDDEPVS
jgi:hypothetical protein